MACVQQSWHGKVPLTLAILVRALLNVRMVNSLGLHLVWGAVMDRRGMHIFDDSVDMAVI